jgi:hypothetical protein
LIIVKKCTETSFDVSNTGLGEASCEAIFRALKGNTTYTKLIISENIIRSAGAEWIAKLLKINTTITDVECRSCSIEKVGHINIHH